MKKITLAVIIIVALSGLLFWGFQSGLFSAKKIKPVAIPEGIILFYGEGCPHCLNVDKFIVENKIEEKVKFTKMEVWYNKDNQVVLAEVALKCNISSTQIGVPFLYDGVGKCYTGDEDIINFFQNEIKTK